MLIAGGLASCLPSIAQELDTQLPSNEDASESWYRTPASYKSNPRAIIHQKAMLRAQQRQARLETISWYQLPTGRPTVPVVWGTLVGPVSFPVPHPPGRVMPYSPWVATAVSVGPVPDAVHAESDRTTSRASQLRR
jgi:hypothetical protein